MLVLRSEIQITITVDESKRWAKNVSPLNAAIIKRCPEELITKYFRMYPICML